MILGGEWQEVAIRPTELTDHNVKYMSTLSKIQKVPMSLDIPSSQNVEEQTLKWKGCKSYRFKGLKVSTIKPNFETLL